MSAGQAPAWSTPELIGMNALDPASAGLAGDGQGNLVIIYSGDLNGNGVYAIHSADSGHTWSDPMPIFFVNDPQQLPYHLQMFMGSAGKVHAVWNVVNSKGDDIAIYYSRLNIALQNWEEPIILAESIESYAGLGAGRFGPAYPVIAATGDDVVVLYNANGGPPTNGRPALWTRLSKDGGQTWTEPVRPFPLHVGLSGAHSLVVDGDGVVHALFLQRIEQMVTDGYSAIAGVWHSEFRDDRWTEPDRLDLGTMSGYDVRAVISQGNLLVATWREDPGKEPIGVWSASRTVNASELPVAALPTVPPAPSPTATPFVLPATSSARSAAVLHGDVPSAPVGNPGGTLVFGVVPVLVALAGIVIANQVLHRGCR